MKAVLARYLSEIVGLAVMALMVVALAAGRAQATSPADVAADAGTVAEVRLASGD